MLLSRRSILSQSKLSVVSGLDLVSKKNLTQPKTTNRMHGVMYWVARNSNLENSDLENSDLENSDHPNLENTDSFNFYITVR